jgi:hypothetical protein
VAYTTSSLADLMVTELGPTGVALGLTDSSDAITEAVAEVAAILGEAVADVDDDLKLRTVARWQAWLAAEAAAVNQYELSSDGSSLKRQQWFEQIGKRLARAEAAASRYSEVQAVLAGSGGVATVTHVVTAGSPYGWEVSGSEFG